MGPSQQQSNLEGQRPAAGGITISPLPPPHILGADSHLFILASSAKLCARSRHMGNTFTSKTRVLRHTQASPAPHSKNPQLVTQTR